MIGVSGGSSVSEVSACGAGHDLGGPAMEFLQRAPCLGGSLFLPLPLAQLMLSLK